uniref:Peptidase M12B domain-containing protein n=1 Tax=Panagrellus redivivus TaxID=6233 RepID=A0A7E4WCY2_PANRE
MASGVKRRLPACDCAIKSESSSATARASSPEDMDRVSLSVSLAREASGAMFWLVLICGLLQKSYAFDYDAAVEWHLYGGSKQGLLSTREIQSPDLTYHRQKRSIDDPHQLNITLDNTEVTFILKDTTLSRNTHLNTDCTYQGKSTNGLYTVAVTGCDEHSLITVFGSHGEYYVIRPAFEKLNTHRVQKRSISDMSHDCAHDHSDDPYPQDRNTTLQMKKLDEFGFSGVQVYPDLTVELGLFVDDAMWNFFQKFYSGNAEKQLRRFVLATVNNIDVLFGQRSIDPKVRLQITHFEVLHTPPMELSRSIHESGEVTKLLRGFCAFQNRVNPKSDEDPKHWDHALLLSGFDLYRGTQRTVAGFAPVKGMCADYKSCTVNEGLDFGAVFVIAHEMGHSLGMYHDGEANHCHAKCCIMSPSIGAGKTHWSDCSIDELHVFVARLGSEDRAINCLLDTHQQVELAEAPLPGQQYSANEQCALFHGECWRHELKDGQTLEDICSIVWCTNDEGIIRTTHPALEGTYCSPGKSCLGGKCVKASHPMPPISGGWGSWEENSRCTDGSCNTCAIKGQLQVRRVFRQCSRPFPLNGGNACDGSPIRGDVCDEKPCDGPSIQEYANDKCYNLSRDIVNSHLGLTGYGLQFSQAMCKVWCQVSERNNIRTMGDFPDGTPCGFNKYCIRGECLKLSCPRKTLVADFQDCPNDRSSLPRNTTSPSIASTPPPMVIDGIWMDWSPWSACVSMDCASPGVRQRERVCVSHRGRDENVDPRCVGAKKQRGQCFKEC